jgi:hypothetical protein
MSKSGGLLQLVSTGRQDIFLTGNPQTTFFKQVYRRYTNFSIETQRIAFETAVDFGKLASLTIPQSGDLLSQMMLEIRLPRLNAAGAVTSTGCSGIESATPINFQNTDPTFSWTNGVGHAMIDYISFQIGQQEIDRQTGEWLHIWSQLTTPYSKYAGFNTMVGFQEVFSQQTQPGPLHLYIPLSFWFCRNIGLALPMIALQSTPIRIYIKFKSGFDMVYSNSLVSDPCQTIVSTPYVQEIALWGDFVYLDVEERRLFTSSRHEYLIEQVQYIKRYSVAAGVQNVSIPLNFNHPLKEIIWVAQQDRMVQYHEWFNYGSRYLNEDGVPNLDLIDSAVLQFDGYDRFERQNAKYFRLYQPWQRHTAIPNSFIYVYSFSLAPEAAQPQGSCNASRLDSIVLQLSMNSSVESRPLGVTVYATNYNVLRIVSGLGGVLFTV